MSNTLSSVVWISHKTIGRLLLSHCYSASVLCKKYCNEKWYSNATCTHCFGQTIIPIKLITVSFLSHNVLAKSLPPLNKTQCLWMLGLNLSLKPKWDSIILCNLLSCILHYHWFLLHFLVHKFLFIGTMMLPFNFTRRQNVIICFIFLLKQQNILHLEHNTGWESSHINTLILYMPHSFGRLILTFLM